MRVERPLSIVMHLAMFSKEQLFYSTISILLWCPCLCELALNYFFLAMSYEFIGGELPAAVKSKILDLLPLASFDHLLNFKEGVKVSNL